MKWITADDLDRWSSQISARTDLSEIVSALVRATVRDPTTLRFPNGDSAQLPGYDGILECSGAPPHVPEGHSVWELSTGDPKAEADKNYEKRSTAPGAVAPKSATFVFVTPRRWRDADEWAKARSAAAVWKDVRVVDAVDLEEWFERAPAVARRYARTHFGRGAAVGVLDTDEFWEEYSSSTNPALNESVLLAGRERERKELTQAIGTPGPVLLRADSPDEAVAFAVAVGRTLEPDARKLFESRALIVEGAEVARQLQHLPKLIFVIRPTAKPVSGALSDRGHTVVVALGNDASSQRNPTIRLTRHPLSDEFVNALVSSGLSQEDAERSAKECARCVTVYQRRRPAADVQRPSWVDDTQRRSALLAAVLAGSWDRRAIGDRDALAKLSRLTYEQFEAQAHSLSTVADPPLEIVGDVWATTAHVDSFTLMAPHLTLGCFELLQEVARTVFGEIDPALELPVEERHLAAVRGKVMVHSQHLRTGLAEVLLYVGVMGSGLELACRPSAQAYVNALIVGIPGLTVDDRLIRSLRAQATFLMEAAPSPLLDALERLLEGGGARIAGIFEETSGLFAASSPHVNVLWGLEVLAWDSEHLPRVVDILGGLAEVDRGGQSMNRPSNSLRSIFLPWMPGTSAPLLSRMKTLDGLLQRRPEVGWKLLLSLLPQSQEMAIPTPRPQWRDTPGSEPVTNALVAASYRAIVQRTIDGAGTSASRWAALVSQIDSLEPAARAHAYERLGTCAQHVTQGDDRLRLWTSLRNEVNRHRRFADAKWALPSAELDVLQAVVDRLEPDDSCIKVAWLFDDYYPDLPERADESSIATADVARGDAMRGLLESVGCDAVLRLSKIVKLPGLVGAAAASVIEEPATIDGLLDSAWAANASPDFSVALAAGAAVRFGDGWQVSFLKRAKKEEWSAERVAVSCLGWPNTRSTWSAITAGGDDLVRAYWSRKAVHLAHEAPVEDVVYVATALVEVGRGCAALFVVWPHASKLNPTTIFSVLDAAFAEIATSKDVPDADIRHYAEEVFENLGSRTDVDANEVARREYRWLPLLDARHKELTLHRLLAEDPSMFVDVLCDVFKAESEPAAAEPTAERRARARHAYELLDSFQSLPGERHPGSVDAEKLSRWVDEVRRLAREKDRVTMADQQIGRLLANAPSDPADGVWPLLAVRDLIERLASAQVEKGIEVASFNRRGVYTKNPFEGGAQERKLSTQASENADSLASWPRTSNVLRRIAASWEFHAKHEDEEAEQERRHHG